MNIFRKTLARIIHAGVNDRLSAQHARYILITNTFAVLIILITLSILLALIINFDLSRAGLPALLTSSLIGFISIPVLNHYGKYNLSRIFISWIPALFSMGISVVSKLNSPENISINDYFDYRFIMLAGAALPLVVFDFNEKGLMALGLLPGILGILLFDLIHNLFGVGFHIQFEDDTYFMTTLLSLLAYLGLLGFMIILKTTSDKFENEIKRQNVSLSEKNEELTAINEVVEQQKAEISEQNEQLSLANDLVATQKLALEQQNEELEMKVKEQTMDIAKANEELRQHNNELTQFAYALSHNIKSPVSSFKGLLQLFDLKGLNQQNREIFGHMEKTIQGMEHVFSDLNKIIEMRQQTSPENDLVNLNIEIEHICSLLVDDFEKKKINLHVNDKIKRPIRSDKLKINSILYNLISNAIKYSSPDRKIEIDITLDIKGLSYCITVRDNGIGLELEEVKDKIFQLYRRFHDHVDGKGLGLYLVRLQAKSLGGFVEVDSQIDAFTEFRVFIPLERNQ